mgnify:CR=1 FL=1
MWSLCLTNKNVYNKAHDLRRNICLSLSPLCCFSDTQTHLLICLPISAGHFPIISRSFIYPSLLCSWEVYLYRLHDLAPLASGFQVSRVNGECQQEIREWRGVRLHVYFLLLPSWALFWQWLIFSTCSHSSCQATVQVLGHFSLPLPFQAIRGNT